MLTHRSAFSSASGWTEKVKPCIRNEVRLLQEAYTVLPVLIGIQCILLALAPDLFKSGACLQHNTRGAIKEGAQARTQHIPGRNGLDLRPQLALVCDTSAAPIFVSVRRTESRGQRSGE